MLLKTKIFFFSLIVLSLSVVGYFIWQNNLPLVSPISLIETIIGNTPASHSQKIVYGFFPYWNLKYADRLQIQSLTHFAYFAVDLNNDGTIKKKTTPIESEPGWNKLKSKETAKLFYQTKLLGQKNILTVTAMEPETIESILSTAENRQTAISSILAIFTDFSFDGLNVDFEYVASADEALRGNFTHFVTNLRSGCLKTKPSCQVDVDIFASAAEKVRLWDLKNLNPVVDKFIVMAYDYYRKSSTQAGPIAPIRGKCSANEIGCLEEDIVTHISQISKLIPPEKIILGIPFYGYQWQTASTAFLANTYPGTGSLATYQRVQSLFQDTEITSMSAQWSKTTLSPYLVFSQEEKIFQVHFENAQSLEQKIKLVKSAGLGGVAIWALGYEGDSPDLWTPINTLFLP